MREAYSVQTIETCVPVAEDSAPGMGSMTQCPRPSFCPVRQPTISVPPCSA